MKELVERVVRIQADAEDIMTHASGVLSAEIGTTVLAIRYWGVHVADADWVLNQPGAVVTLRNVDTDIPYEVSAEMDGVKVFAITSDPAYKELVK